MALRTIKLSENKVKIEMARKGYSQTDLAKAVGISSQRMGAIFKTAIVSTPNAGRIAKALEVDITKIIE